MKIEFIKHQILSDDPWYFELGIGWQTGRWHEYKTLINISLCFWSIYIRYGGNK
jgi:hypothetical protein